MTPEQRALDLIECMTNEELAAARALVVRAITRPRPGPSEDDLILAYWMKYLWETSNEHLARS